MGGDEGREWIRETANPQPERESDIDAPADRLPAPVQLIDVYTD